MAKGVRRGDANNSGSDTADVPQKEERTEAKFMRNVCDTREAWQRRGVVGLPNN